MITGEMFFVKVEMYATDNICCIDEPHSQVRLRLTSANHPDFHFHIFIDFSYFSCTFSTYWNLMLWYIKHIYFQKLLIYVKVRDTNVAICFFFRLMDFSYEIVMAIYIEEVIRGQENDLLKMYAV
jgi:signal transduction histidine kinase